MAFNRKQRLRDNIEAIRTAFTLDREQRTPTARERLLLERYCGFGGLKCILNPARELTDAVHWAKSDLELFVPTVELHKLLRENTKDDTEYKRYMDAMKQSVLTAFYTPPEITGTIADVLHEHGIRPDRVLEPSAGVGAFVDAVLENKPDADIMAFEKDLMTGKILKHLHPDQKVRIQGYEKIEKPFMNHFDLAVSNIPFGDVAVFDPEFSGSKDPARHSAARTIHNYFFLKSLDAVREGGIVAFITSQGVLDAPTNAPIREYMMNHANLVGVARLPNNLFTENAGTEVGSDLIILQKNSGKNGELYYNEKLFVQTEQTPIGTSVNGYVWSIGSLSHTDLTQSTDPYGKPAYKLIHRGDIAQLAEDLREHLKIELHQLNRELYEKHSLHPTQTESTDKSTPEEVQPSPKVEAATSTANVFITGAEKPKSQSIDEKPEIEPRRTNHSNAVQLTLLDLWGMPIEEPAKKKKAAKKESSAKRAIPKPKPQVTAAPPVETVKPATENKEAKPENIVKQSDPDDIYATLDWDTNPPINGFYETMMSLTPERRKALRLEAERHRQEQLKKPGVKDTLNPAFAPSSDNKPEKETAQQPEAQPEATPVPVTDNSPSEQAATSLFPEFEPEKPKEEAPDLSPRPYHRTPEMHLREGSLVASRARDIGYLKDITPYGATFHPLGLTGFQKEKALLYVSLRDAYERLYRYETNRREANPVWREHLNTCYDEFVMRYGNLNARQNVKLVMMDAGGRDILSL
ncbi:N-6 DNA methylase, partial [uncultured Bacteroides sp.]|uniref:N-6 DNA methylase n=1 Tax=uncultured Bacteroides sp. TaxID=162156 RepID=UPI002670003D